MLRARRCLQVLATAVLAGSVLAGCGDSDKFAPDPPPYMPPGDQIAKAKAPKFRPIIKALVAERKSARLMREFRATAPRNMDAEQQKKYEELFAISTEAAGKVAVEIKKANLTPEEMKTWAVIDALDESQLEAMFE
jgi:hypothetical protein